MVIKPSINLTVNNHTVERVDSFKFLGFTLDEHLKWDKHICVILCLFGKWQGIFYMPSRIDEAGHTKAFYYPDAEHWGGGGAKCQTMFMQKKDESNSGALRFTTIICAIRRMLRYAITTSKAAFT